MKQDDTKFLPLVSLDFLQTFIGKRMTRLIRYASGTPDEFVSETGWPEKVIFSYAGIGTEMVFEDGVGLILGYRPDYDSVLVHQDGVDYPPAASEPGIIAIDATDPKYSKKKYAELLGKRLKKITLFRSKRRSESSRFPNQIGLGFYFEGGGGFVFGCGYEDDQNGAILLGLDEISPSTRPVVKEEQIAPKASFFKWPFDKL